MEYCNRLSAGISRYKKYFAILEYSPRIGIFATAFEDITDRHREEQEFQAAYQQIAAVEEEL
ncbi:MAG: hypothetical protein WCF90_04730 [Methanomicrobiales archaeon]